MFWKNKKGQLTLFIIIGILLVIFGILIYVFTLETAEFPLDESGIETPEYERIKNFVDSCVAPISLEGIEIQRLQGGFIHIPASYFSLDVVDPEGNTVEEVNGFKRVLKGDGRNSVAYWLTKEGIQFPSKGLMADQLEDYISGRLPDCVDNFAVLEDQGFVIDAEIPVSAVFFGKQVVVEVEFPIRAELGDAKVVLRSFRYEIPIDLEKIHKIGVKIMAHEDLFSFLESDTKRLISVYSGLSSAKLPPFSATTSNLDCDYVQWEDGRVQGILQGVLAKNIPLIQVDNTRTRFSGENPEQQQFIDSLREDVGLANPENMDVLFSYTGGFNRYDIRPRLGEGISPPDRTASTNVPLLPQICTFSYRYKYDLEYPVIVTLIDYDSEKSDGSGEKGFTFRFPLWVYLCGNNERGCEDIAEFVKRGFDVDQGILEQAEIVETGFCDEGNRNSGQISVEIKSEGEELAGVDVRYLCGSENNDCYIGRTNANGVLFSSFPQCFNGILMFSKSGYGTKREVVSIGGAAQSLRFDLDKEKIMDVDVRVVRVLDYLEGREQHTLGEAYTLSRSLLGKEDALIFGSGTTSFSFLFPDVQKNTIKLTPGEYQLELILKSILRIKPSFISAQGQNIEVSYNPLGTGVYEGEWIASSLSAIPFSVSEVKGKSKTTFFILTQFRPGDDLVTNDFRDDVFDEQGNIVAELLWRKNFVNGSCVGDERLIGVDGIEQKGFLAGVCERVSEVFVSKQEYSQFIKPRLI